MVKTCSKGRIEVSAILCDYFSTDINEEKGSIPLRTELVHMASPSKVTLLGALPKP